MTAAYALIPAAGRGARFSTDGPPKVYADLCGCPLLRWTVAAFAAHPEIDGIVVVAGAADVGRCRGVLDGLDKVMAVVPGGSSRQDSVAVGLYALGGAEDDLVLVHDGARPLVSAPIIGRCLAGARANGNAVAALPAADTLKEAAGPARSVVRTVNRDGLWAVQTPQAFGVRTLFQAHAQAREQAFAGTDEASLVERLEGETVYLVPGSPENFKVTQADDLRLAEAVLQSRLGSAAPEVRVGFGYDIHRFGEGRRLVLGGVAIDGARGLEGHSDADVLLHALCDALLGAAGLPDIGTLYPNTDPSWEGIASTVLLADTASRIGRAGFRVVNVDMTLIAEAPKIAPFVPRMRAVIAEALGIGPERIGIKATTNEGLDALGQGAGIAAHAVAGLARAPVRAE